MRKRILGLTLALVISLTATATVSASREQELRDEQAWTSQQLDATYARINDLWYAKSQLESEIAALDATLVEVMVTIDVLKNDITEKEAEIENTKSNLEKAENARDKQYEAMKKRIQHLYEKGGSDAWFQMMMGAENLSDLLTKAEYTQQMYEYDRESLDKYVSTIEQVESLKTQYEAEKAELEDMKLSYEEQSANLQYQMEQKQITSANYSSEIAYAEQLATEYANLIAEQQAEIERLEAERIAAEEEARRQAEAEAAAAAAAAEAEDDYDDSDDYSDDDYSDDDYSESDSSDDVDYDEYGNVVDDDNTVSDVSYESTTTSGSGAGSSVVSYALQFVGNPYVWGGTSLTNGADCSGFVQSVYAAFGVSLPRTSYAQMSAGYEVSYADAQPGDLICYGGHVAIYIGNGQIAHASNSAAYPAGGIKVSDNAAYRTILSVRRVI